MSFSPQPGSTAAGPASAVPHAHAPVLGHGSHAASSASTSTASISTAAGAQVSAVCHVAAVTAGTCHAKEEDRSPDVDDDDRDGGHASSLSPAAPLCAHASAAAVRWNLRNPRHWLVTLGKDADAHLSLGTRNSPVAPTQGPAPTAVPPSPSHVAKPRRRAKKDDRGEDDHDDDRGDPRDDATSIASQSDTAQAGLPRGLPPPTSRVPMAGALASAVRSAAAATRDRTRSSLITTLTMAMFYIIATTVRTHEGRHSTPEYGHPAWTAESMPAGATMCAATGSADVRAVAHAGIDSAAHAGWPYSGVL